MSPRIPAIDRFWPNVDKGGPIPERAPELGPCWIWTAALSTSGYGRFYDGVRDASAHRFSYRLHIGPIPDGLTVDHLCFVPRCVNPGHLRLLTNAENARGGATVAANAAKTHCPRGHEYTPENTRARANGWRECRTCHRERMRTARAQAQIA